jgi:hypothetical protein
MEDESSEGILISMFINQYVLGVLWGKNKIFVYMKKEYSIIMAYFIYRYVRSFAPWPQDLGQ